ncbi:MAG: DUF302 domain-containing protein [Kiloniellales bacterium]|nr:DUF302 domain-containing protein [Kiloniellales bacterium]
MILLRRTLAALLAATVLVAAAHAIRAAPPGFTSFATSHDFQTLVERVKAAVEANGMFVVTRASASKGAASRGLAIPGNMVLGVYRNDFAVRMLEASVPAGIEAPIRFYVTENADGTASLSYRAPSAVFAPYEDGGEALVALAGELDRIFAAIAAQAAGTDPISP